MAEIQENKMGVMPIPKLVLNMSIPLMLSLLVQSLYNIVDSIFVAKVSENALTATSLVFPVQILMIAVAVGTAVGVNAIMSKKLGEGDRKAVGRIATTGLVLSLLSSLVFMLIGIFFSDLISKSLTDDPEIREYCRRYMFICTILCAGTFIGTMFQRYLQAAGYTFESMLTLIIGAGSNIILDPIFIFGIGPIPRMEIKGAAIATVIGQWLCALAAYLLNKFKNPDVKLQIKGYKMEGHTVGQIYKIGGPTIITQASGCVMVTAMNAILISYSSTIVALFGVYYKLQNFLCMPLIGLGQSAIPIVGYNYGAKKSKRISKTMQIMLPAAIVIAIVGTVIFMALPSQLLSLFSASDEMLKIGVPALRIISATFVFTAVTIVLGYIVSGLSNGIVNMMGTLLRQLILLIPSAWLLAKFTGVDNIWYAFWISEVIAAVYSIIHTKIFYKKKIREIKESENPQQSNAGV